jgi:hypothetical protein
MTTGNYIPASAQAFLPLPEQPLQANLSMGHPSIAIAINGFPPSIHIA